MHSLIQSIQEETGYQDVRALVDRIPSLAKRISTIEKELERDPKPAVAMRYRRLLSQAVAAARASANQQLSTADDKGFKILKLKERYNEFLRAWKAAVEIIPRSDLQPREWFEREEKALREALGDLIEELIALGIQPSREEIAEGFTIEGQQRLPIARGQ